LQTDIATQNTSEAVDQRLAARDGTAQPRSRARIMVRAVIAMGVLLGGLAGFSAPASAASSYPHCSTNYTFSTNTGPMYSPAGRKLLNGSYYYTWDCWMAYGDSNNAVRQLQSNLNKCYGTTYYGGINLGINLATDGSYGPKTKAAVLLVQKQYWYLAKDGIYGPNTAEAVWHMGYNTSMGRLACTHPPQPILQ
jgi:Putative peptidoglycan binding domain